MVKRPNVSYEHWRNGVDITLTNGGTGTLNIRPVWVRGNEENEGDRDRHYTHIAEVPINVDIRDDYDGTTDPPTPLEFLVIPENGGSGPDETHEQYTVVFVEVERHFRGNYFKRIYLLEQGSGVITVREVDLNPTVTSVAILEFHEEDGFVVSTPSAGTARVDIQAATTGQNGIVNTEDQAFAGTKEFTNNIWLNETLGGGSIFINTGKTGYISGSNGGSGDIITARASVPADGTSYLEFIVSRHASRFFFNASNGIAPSIEIKDASEVVRTGVSATNSGGIASITTVAGIVTNVTTGVGAHASNHTTGGSDEIDGDQIDIDFTPSNYTPSTTPSEASNVDHLTAHLAGIDDAIADVIPVGMIMARASTSVPTGWLNCDGSAVSRTTYADLFTQIGTTWGAGNGTTTFNVPDLRSRNIMGEGTGTGLTARTIGGSFGSETHTLDATEIPGHMHATTATWSFRIFKAGSSFAFPSGASTNESGVSQTASTGGGGAHNNIQPNAVCRFMIKT